jgi:hypothetical protein
MIMKFRYLNEQSRGWTQCAFGEHDWAAAGWGFFRLFSLIGRVENIQSRDWSLSL